MSNTESWAIAGFCACDYDVSDFYSSASRVARKAHRCYECGRTIQIGERYLYASGKCEGAMWSAHTCVQCLAVVEWIRAHVPCFCWAHGGLYENLQDMIWDARTLGFDFGLLRRIVLVKRAREILPRPAQSRALSP